MPVTSFLMVSLLAPLVGPPSPQRVLDVTLRSNAIRSVAVAPDGKGIAAGGVDRVVRQWVLPAGKEMAPIKLAAAASDVAFAPDGKQLATLGSGLEMWAASSGKPTGAFPDLSANQLAWSLDGRLAVASHRVKLLKPDSAKPPVEMPEQAGWQNTCVAFSPDGSRVAAGDLRGSVWVWEAGSGTQTLRRKVHPNRVSGIGFIDDGATLVTGGIDGKMTFLDLKSGREVGGFFPHQAAPLGIAALVCSFDGKLIVTAGAGDGTIKLWEAASGRLRAAITVPSATWSCVAIALDGSTVAAGGKRGDDGIVLAWRLYASGPSLTASVRPALWTSLAGDAPTAYHAMLTLASQPSEAVKLLGQRLRPVVLDASTREECDALIARLEADTFAIRDEAYHKLELMSPWIEAHLKQALASAKTLELQRRLQTLITKVAESTLPLVRAVEVLEHAPGKEARQLLKRLAAGQPEARITREARRALERCERLEALR